MRAYKRLIFIVLMVGLFGLCACSKKIDLSRLAGRFEASHENGFETIELRQDGSYTHYFRASAGANTIYSNSWKAEPFEGEPKVALRGFTPHFPDAQGGDNALLDVEKDWGYIRLYRSFDLDQYYQKK